MKKLESAGGLKLDNIMKIVEGDEEHNDLKGYLSFLVEDYLKDAKLLINEKKDHYDRNVIKQARTIFSNRIVESLMDKISAENKIKKGSGK